MSIDELDVLANNKDMASSLDMSPILLHECNTNSEYLEHKYWSLQIEINAVHKNMQVKYLNLLL